MTVLLTLRLRYIDESENIVCEEVSWPHIFLNQDHFSNFLGIWPVLESAILDEIMEDVPTCLGVDLEIDPRQKLKKEINIGINPS